MRARSPSPSSTDQFEIRPLRGLLDHLADREPAARGQLVARQPDEGEHIALEDRADEHEGRPRPVGERHGGDDQLAHRLDAEADQQIVGKRGDGVAKRLAAMARRDRSRIRSRAAGSRWRSSGTSSTGALSASLVHRPAWTPIAGDLAAFADRDDDEVERHPAMDRGAALRLGEQRDDRRRPRNSASRRALRRDRSARRAAGTGRACRWAGRPAARPRSRAGSSRRRRTSAASAAPSSSPAASASARIRACIARQSVTAARTSARTRWRSATISRRPRASARSTSRYIIDSRRSASSQSGSTAIRSPSSSRATQTTGMEQAVDDEVARGERVGDGIDQERHVVVDDADPHPPMAERSAQRSRAGRERFRPAG